MERFWIFFLNRYRFTYLLVSVIMLLGIISIWSMPKESDPQVSIPIGVVSTVLPGASAGDVESLVTDEIEKKVLDLDDIKKVTSTSSEGISTIIAEFEASSDIVDRIRALKDAVDEAVPSLPSEAQRPFVKHISVSDEPILVVTLALNASEDELHRLSESIRDEIEAVSGVSEVTLSGVRNREVQITVDEAKLSQYGMSLSEVLQSLRNQNANLPVGSIEQNKTLYTIRFEGGIDTTEKIASLPVKTVGNYPVFIRDIASVTDGFSTQSTLARLSLTGQKAQRAISLNVFKKDKTDVIELVDTIHARLDNLKSTTLSNVQVHFSLDRAERIREDINNLLINGLETVIIVALLLLVFLGKREAIVAGISIPLTFLVAFIILGLLGSTLNFLVLFSLILALGILVDSAIVVTQSMHVEMGKGLSPIDAAQTTIRQFQWPIISGVLTTMSAFVPMMFASGVTGQFIRSIPITVNLVLGASLFVSLALIPMLASRVMKSQKKGQAALPVGPHPNPPLERGGNMVAPETRDKYQIGAHNATSQPERPHLIDRLANWYGKTLEHFLRNADRQKKLAKLLFIALAVSFAMPFTGLLKATLFPTVDIDFFTIELEMPVGTTLEKTNTVVEKVEEQLYPDPIIESFITTVGTGGGQSLGAAPKSTHLARIQVNLPKEDERDITSVELVEVYRQKLGGIDTEAIVRVSQLQAGPPSGSPIEIAFDGNDRKEISRLVTAGQKILQNIPGAVNIETSLKPAPVDFAISVDRAKAQQLGISPLNIAQTLRTALFGTDALTIKKGGEEIKVNVRLNLNSSSSDSHRTHETTISRLLALTIQSPNGPVQLGSLVSATLEGGTTSINHRNGKRTATVTAKLAASVTTQEVISAFQYRVDELQMSEGTTIRYGGEAEEVAQSFTDMYKALIIGLFLIAAILVLQFQSFRQPLFIMATIPLALIGVLPGLTITLQPLSFPAFIGIVALIGIVVNNAIILIDRINANRRKNLSKHEAIHEAAISRLEPIFLTTITTVAGIFPLAISNPIWGPLGFSIIFGLMFSTVLTLFVIPMLYLKWAEEEMPESLSEK